jgi:hypothetical protein
MALEWGTPAPTSDWLEDLRWRWAHWRARRCVWRADLAYRRWPSVANLLPRDRAATHLRRVEAGRP